MKAINQVAGRKIEITIRGERSFTFSFDGIDSDCTQRICKFFDGHGQIAVETDEECGTFIYLDGAAA